MKTFLRLGAAVVLVVVPAARATGQLPLFAPKCFGLSATITGTEGDDVLVGTEDVDVIAALDGDDVVKGLDGGDALCGGNGDDELVGGNGRDAVAAGRGADDARGGPGLDLVLEFWVDSCSPCLPNDPRSRDDSADHISGGPGPDWMGAEGGNDVIDGGAGVDLAVHVSRFTSVVVDLQFGTAVSSAGGVDELRGIEGVFGSVNPDELYGDAGPNWLGGSLGVDHVDGRDGADVVWASLLGDLLIGGFDESSDVLRVSLQEPAYVDLTAGLAYSRETAHGHFPDKIAGFEDAVGTPYDDVLVGDEGSNLLEGLYGTDEVSGGGGNDRLFGDDEEPTLYWNGIGPGNDVLDGGAGHDRLDGGPLADECSNGEVYVACETRDGETGPSYARPAPPWWWSGLQIEYLRTPELVSAALELAAR